MPGSYIGSTVVLKCVSEIGTVKGVVKEVNTESPSITLVNSEINGKPCPASKVNISGGDILEIDVVAEKARDRSSQSGNQDDSGFLGIVDFTTEVKSKHNKIEKSSQSMEAVPTSSRQTSRSRRDNSTFNAPIHQLNEEFDFDANLKLFDKQAFFTEMNGSEPSSPQPLRANQGNSSLSGSRSNSRNGNPALFSTPHKSQSYSEMKMKFDENVLQSTYIPTCQAITISRGPSPPTVVNYLTEDGIQVPGVSDAFRDSVLAASVTAGIGSSRIVETVARAVCEMVVKLIDGANRWTDGFFIYYERILPQAHTEERSSASKRSLSVRRALYGLCAARHLANHALNVTCFVAADAAPGGCVGFADELKLFELTDGRVVRTYKDLPELTDLTVNCLSALANQSADWYHYVVAYTANQRSSVLAIDPVPVQRGFIEAKWSICVALPLCLEPHDGAVYLCDAGVPRKIFKLCGVKYVSPFGHRFYVSLRRM